MYLLATYTLDKCHIDTYNKYVTYRHAKGGQI